jgi:hypothetical protein
VQEIKQLSVKEKIALEIYVAILPTQKNDPDHTAAMAFMHAESFLKVRNATRRSEKNQ